MYLCIDPIFSSLRVALHCFLILAPLYFLPDSTWYYYCIKAMYLVFVPCQLRSVESVETSSEELQEYSKQAMQQQCDGETRNLAV